MYFLPLILASVFFFAGLFTLSDYGINWDAPNRMIRGQAFTHYFLTSHKSFDTTETTSPILVNLNDYISRFDFNATEEPVPGLELKPVTLPERPLPQIEKRPSFYQSQFWNGDNLITYDSGHPPLADDLAALSNDLFWGKLKWFGDIQSYQLFYLLISSIGVFVVGAFAFDLTASWLAALVSCLCLALFPLFFAESHLNMKDPLQASLFAGSIWSFWHWVKSSKTRWLIIFGGFVIGAMGIKWNIIFLPLILIPWLLFISKTPEVKKWFTLKRIVLALIFLLVTCILLLILTWPYLWADPINRLLGILKFYGDTGLRPDPFQPEGFILPGRLNSYPLVLLLAQTPEIILVLAIIGVIWGIRERGGILKTNYLLLLWLVVPVLRISLPHVWFYNGLRQIMEVLPAMAVSAGLGANFLVQSTKAVPAGRQGKVPGLLGNIIIITFIMVINLIPILKLHPNENVYFNSLVGGLKGATEKNLADKKITYGNIYKQAADWLNQNASQDSNIAFLDGPTFALSPLFLRSDLSLSPYHFSGYDQKGEYILSLYDPNPEINFAALYPEKLLKPVHQIKVDGVPILTIYQNKSNFLKEEIKMQSTSSFKLQPKPASNGYFLELDLGKELRVTKLTLMSPFKDCPSTFVPYIDEFISFDSGKKYGLQERRKISQNEIEYSFPAEKTRLIKIFPQSTLSCFRRGRITSVSYY